MVRLIGDGINTTEEIVANGIPANDVQQLSSPACRDHIAYCVSGKLILTREGDDLLYHLHKADIDHQYRNIITIATVVAAIGSILSAILLGIQTLSH